MLFECYDVGAMASMRDDKINWINCINIIMIVVNCVNGIYEQACNKRGG